MGLWQVSQHISASFDEQVRTDILYVHSRSLWLDIKILFLVMDGLGDIPADGRDTPLAEAHTPNLDNLAKAGTLGLCDPISPGLTPGSGPAHLSLFGYDPIENNVGRGLLSAFGLNFELQEGDLAARGNFCTLDEKFQSIHL